MEEILMEMDPIEAEVDAIRHQIYEETKHMTLEEHIAYFMKKTAPIVKQFNIKISKLKPVKPHKRPPDQEEY